MVIVRVIFGGRFLFYFGFLCCGGVVNETIILLGLIRHEMIVANSYPTRAAEIIVNYSLKKNMFARIFKEQLTLKHFVV